MITDAGKRQCDSNEITTTNETCAQSIASFCVSNKMRRKMVEGYTPSSLSPASSSSSSSSRSPSAGSKSSPSLSSFTHTQTDTSSPLTASYTCLLTDIPVTSVATGVVPPYLFHRSPDKLCCVMTKTSRKCIIVLPFLVKNMHINKTNTPLKSANTLVADNIR